MAGYLRAGYYGYMAPVWEQKRNTGQVFQNFQVLFSFNMTDHMKETITWAGLGLKVTLLTVTIWWSAAVLKQAIVC